MKKLLSICALALLCACGDTLNTTLTTFVVPEDRAKIDALLADPTKLRNFLANTTRKTWNSRHGTQVEYMSADGHTWLVYPGNIASVDGEWQVQGANGQSKVCFRYGANTYNPVTRKPGGRWNCVPSITVLMNPSSQIVDGDVLKLRGRGAFPQTMPYRTNISLNTIKKAVGLGPLTQPNKIAWRETR
ncbi:MAG: hypothetical protein ACRBBQ_17200 [Cognatishimia sp.]